MSIWIDRGHELKRYLREERNVCPDAIEGHGHDSYSLIWYITKVESIFCPEPAWSIRETLKEQCADIFRITKCREIRPRVIRCNIVVTNNDAIFYQGERE